MDDRNVMVVCVSQGTKPVSTPILAPEPDYPQEKESKFYWRDGVKGGVSALLTASAAMNGADVTIKVQGPAWGEGEGERAG